MEPAQAFIEGMGARLKKLSPGIHAYPRINRSIFRIYKDVRFSKDKSPYKTHLGIWLWEGEGAKFESSGYYFHLEPPNILLGVGIHIFSKNLLKAYREAVVDPVAGDALVKAVQEVSQKGCYNLGEEHYKRVPRGYDPERPNAELLDYSYQRYFDMHPIQHWLYELTWGWKVIRLLHS